MTWRLLQISILGLWLVATGLLVQRTYFPDENRFPPADLKFISDLYFSNAETTDLVLLRDGQPFGRISMTLPKRDRGSDLLPVRAASFVGYLEADLEDGIRDLQWNGAIVMDDQMGLRSIRFRPTSLLLSGEIDLSWEPLKLNYKLVQNDIVVLDSRDPQMTRDRLALMEPLAKDSGLSLGILGDPASKETLGMIAAIRPVVSARHGQFKINGNPYEGYVVTYTVMEEAKFRLYFSDQGELLMADGPPGVTLLAETFVTRKVPGPRARANMR